jgi:FtsZ-binding cell division protein ZapB
MNTLICQYCKTEFSNLYNMNSHQRKAKYCLLIQGKENTIDKNKTEFKCKYCKKNLASKQKLAYHIDICDKKFILLLDELKEKDKKIQDQEKVFIKLKSRIEQLEEQNTNYKEQVKDLQDKLDRIANKAIDRPTTMTNNTTLNIASFMDFNDIDKIKNTIENRLNINHVVDGQKGLANFVKDNLLTDDTGKLLYICTDPSRNIFKYKDSTGEVKKDVEAKKLTNYILEGGIRTKSAVIGNEWCKDDKGDINMGRFNVMMEQQQSIMKLSDDNNNFKKELAAITTS